MEICMRAQTGKVNANNIFCRPTPATLGGRNPAARMRFPLGAHAVPGRDVGRRLSDGLGPERPEQPGRVYAVMRDAVPYAT